MSAPRLVCLLPARNAAADLPGFFASAARFADAVIALDDGSTDDTAEMLAANPLVQTLLRNPRRPGYRGWNDAANRNRLLRAAATLEPDWIISVDADERIDPDDASALRDFLACDALPGIAYGFRCYPMYGDLVHYVPTPIWVYRLFAYAPGQAFPERALHFAPIPTSIPRRAFVRTTLRIQHLGGLTREHRIARYEKYREADPDRAYWPDYTPLLTDPDAGNVHVWEARGANLPVLGPIEDESSPGVAAGQPRDETLAVVVLGDDNTESVLEAIRAVQIAAESAPVELALAAPLGSPCLTAAEDASPAVTRVPFDPTRVDARRAAAGAVTSGYLLLLPPSMRVAPAAFGALLRAHQRGYALAAATVTDGGRRWQERADYLLAYGGGGRRTGALEGAPALCSYARDALADPALAGLGDTEANRLLTRWGYLAYREPEALVTYRNQGVTMSGVLAGAFRRGCSEGEYLVTAGAERGAVLNRQLLKERVLTALPRRIARHAAQTEDSRVKLLAVAGEVTVLLGVVASLIRPEPGKLSVLVGRPAGTLLAAVVDRERGECLALSLLRYDLVAGELREAALPPMLAIQADDGETRALAGELGLDRPMATLPTRFAIDDIVARRFGVSVDHCLLLDCALTGAPPDGLTNALRTLGSARGLPRVMAALRRREAQSTLSPAALLLLCRGIHEIESGSRECAQTVAPDGESFTELAERVRAAVARRDSPRRRTPRDALKLVEWA